MDFCTSCQLAKSHRLPFPQSVSRALHPFELVHSDLWGPSPITSITSVKYFILFIDDFSRFSWFYLLKSKDEAYNAYLQFQTLIKTQFNTVIKKIRSDWGGEFRPCPLSLTNKECTMSSPVLTPLNKTGVWSAKIDMLSILV